MPLPTSCRGIVQFHKNMTIKRYIDMNSKTPNL